MRVEKYLLIVSIGSSFLFPSCAVTPPGTGVAPEKSLASYQTEDPILKPAFTQVKKLMPSLVRSILERDVDYLILDFHGRNQELLGPKYYTDSCKCLFRDVPNPLAICNADFLYEIEGVIRSLILFPSHFASDQSLFDLASRIRSDPYGYLQEIRKSSPKGVRPETLDQQLTQQMKLMMLFFFGHELGHLKDQLSGRSFASMLSPQAPLEERTREAVVRMCRHADEFERFGFGLPGFGWAVDVSSEIRRPELRFRKEIEAFNANVVQWFQEEIRADNFANKLMENYLASLEKTGKILALEEQHLFIASLFFIAVYYWYKDLDFFATQVCGTPIQNSHQLMICMMKSRDQYVKAASLFGEVHRFPLLRSILTIKYLLDKRTDFFKLSPEKRTIWITQKEMEKLTQEEKMLKRWYFAALQQYHTLAILMDTPVKFAHIGCATGWMKEIDETRKTPQLLIMNFETINQVYQRLKEFR